MSANILANRQRYLAMVDELLVERLSGEAFAQAFLAERENDLVKDDLVAKNWSRRHDVDLTHALDTGALTVDEFSAAWHELWGYPEGDPFLRFFESVFSVVEAYEPDAEIFEMPRGEFDYYFHDESELRRQVGELLTELERQEAYLEANRLETKETRV